MPLPNILGSRCRRDRLASSFAQIGQPLPIGAKSGIYTEAFWQLHRSARVRGGSGPEKGQWPEGRPTSGLSPGTLAPIHPVAFLVITKPQVYGVPVSEELRGRMIGGRLSYTVFGLGESALDVTRIEPRATESGHVVDMEGVVTTLDGDPLPAGDISSRLGGFKDIEEFRYEPPPPGATQDDFGEFQLIETILGSKNDQHKIVPGFPNVSGQGRENRFAARPLLYGAYNLNPFLVRVEQVPMLVVEQGSSGGDQILCRVAH